MRLIVRLLEKLKEYANTEEGSDKFVIYDEVSKDISTQKGIFPYPCIPYISVNPYHKNPNEKILKLGIALHDHDLTCYGCVMICTIDEMIEKLEKKQYSTSFAHDFQSFYNTLEDKIFEYR